MYQITALSILLYVCVLTPVGVGRLSPIVVMPGLAGSQLEAKLTKNSSPHYFCYKHLDWFTIWLNVEEFLPYIVDCFAENMMLRFDRNTGIFSNASHIEIRAPGFGNTSTIEYIDTDRVIGKYFYGLIESLRKEGYVRGVNIHGAPYDWRLAPDSLSKLGYFKKLSDLIEKTYQKNHNISITLICHSLGCPTILYFLNTHVSNVWKDKYIHHLITAAGAWAGSIVAIQSIISGSNFMIPTIAPLSLRLPERTLASNYFLLPYREVFGKDNPVISVGSVEYKLTDLNQLFTNLNVSNASAIWKQVSNLNKGFSDPRVPVYCIHGDFVPTGEKLIYSEDGFPDKAPTYITGRGDGTVNLVSLQVCLKWKDSTAGFQHLVIDGKEGEHSTIINSPQILKIILNIVRMGN
ncbi:Group XV phospholipase A2-like [Oopsacas minuta]|uniref:Group XV phospholipase A2-like n=1 Tax=Oopsacas minuta TaxID=111878 RepID=A0AAV7JWF3_9METZ|nr:Group XV phospholipase A2-like [Oopsacas minuta]